MGIPPEVVARINECATHDFLATRDHWFACLKWSTTVVALGLVLELPELVYELADIARDKIDSLKYRVVLLEKWLRAARVLAFVGWFMIVGGVVGERYAEVRVNDADTSIQTCSDAKVRVAIIEAGDAAQSASIAHEEADAVKGIADEAKKDAKDALVKAQAAQHSLAQAESDAAKAQMASSNALSKAAEAESHIADAVRQANDVSNRVAEAKKDLVRTFPISYICQTCK